jgi:hypothetical protein
MRSRLNSITPVLVAETAAAEALPGIGVGEREVDELCVPTSGDPARAERSRVDGGGESERGEA